MDDNTKQHIEATETRIAAKFDAIEARFYVKLETRLNYAFTQCSQHLLHEITLRIQEATAPLALSMRG